jgi:hypothetical protein
MTASRLPTEIGKILAPLFGGQPDGTYKVPGDLLGDADLMPLIHRAAEIGRVGVEEVLDLDWIDLLEDIYVEAVRNEAGRLRHHARQHGHAHLEQKLGEVMAERAAHDLLSPRDGGSNV